MQHEDLCFTTRPSGGYMAAVAAGERYPHRAVETISQQR
jgi:hypothetical protein